MMHIPGKKQWDGVRFIMLLRRACNVKLIKLFVFGIFYVIFSDCSLTMSKTAESKTSDKGGLLSSSVTSDSLGLFGLQPTRLLCPWDFSGKSTGMSCHFLLQGIFLTQGLKLHLLCLLHCRWTLPIEPYWSGFTIYKNQLQWNCFWNGKVRSSETFLFHKSNKNIGQTNKQTNKKNSPNSHFSKLKINPRLAIIQRKYNQETTEPHQCSNHCGDRIVWNSQKSPNLRELLLANMSDSHGNSNSQNLPLT